MYSWEIDERLKGSNYTIDKNDYRDITNQNNNPQISYIGYDPYNNEFKLGTNDGYFWKFRLKG